MRNAIDAVDRACDIHINMLVITTLSSEPPLPPLSSNHSPSASDLLRPLLPSVMVRPARFVLLLLLTRRRRALISRSSSRAAASTSSTASAPSTTTTPSSHRTASPARKARRSIIIFIRISTIRSRLPIRRGFQLRLSHPGTRARPTSRKSQPTLQLRQPLGIARQHHRPPLDRLVRHIGLTLKRSTRLRASRG